MHISKQIKTAKHRKKHIYIYTVSDFEIKYDNICVADLVRT